jgi:PIN domain nuclease of toxin-antitoxin system
MKFILDTHIWIWSYVEPHKLSSEVMREVSSPANDWFLSSASVWEMVMLLEKKRIQLDCDFRAWFKNSTEELNLTEIPITWEVAHELRFTTLGHRDPGDRFLVATAKVHDLTLVTADERLMQIPGLKVLANR